MKLDNEKQRELLLAILRTVTVQGIEMAKELINLYDIIENAPLEGGDKDGIV